jgi:hypothetical protein
MYLTKYCDRAINYDAYVDLLGGNLEVHNLHYKKYAVSEEMHSVLSQAEPVKILVLTEPWCSDSVAIVPVIKKIVDEAHGWELKVLLRDENPDLMDQFLTGGSRGIPVFIFLDEQCKELFSFGPRPEAAQKIFESYRRDLRAGKIEKAEIIKKIRSFYAKDRGRAIDSELIRLLSERLPSLRNESVMSAH